MAALFNQAVLEMALLAGWIKSDSPSGATDDVDAAIAFDLAGLGDLHVTVGGGRNSRLGHLLGNGERLSWVLAKAMAGVTVEGVDAGRQLASGVHAACTSGRLDPKRLPLTLAILTCIERDTPFELSVASLP